MVEGRVAGALWDMIDTTNDGYDTMSTSLSDIIRVFTTKKPGTFAQFWSGWIASGYSPSFIGCLNQNTIYY
ncbi:hypothetical protein [Brevibacillus brevis]|uniref:Uncharacterized protein n=1 Tax=Brevibacillus brevis TaxID=1393 RepID=A0ABY9T860_BREBE|nr:hypothetical protein [Brevibacillus brevis]WNC16280.1 hypothetical protein RGB73_08170 [Brevibacillus brevis]